jgi:hypothetical protein
MKREYSSQAKLNKHEHEHESAMKILVDKSNKKYQQVLMNMIMISQKLYDKCSMWQK